MAGCAGYKPKNAMHALLVRICEYHHEARSVQALHFLEIQSFE